MTEQEFFSIDVRERALMINELLSKENKDQLKKVAENLQIPYGRFTK
ncbi:hypothetical protein QNH39_27765 [Neobacillus novalis]|uniref:Uncharacterized protein n=1 Tax=Neobacillus novalis TaxID=220687 RepID=A0AA95MQP8_9BACI|nr:hypothetical protein [Neobacillus novalis]WHY86318.1 hypothetical protein QNH39_27765 [Neobacillus novalis]